MRNLRAWCLRFTGLFGRQRLERELAEEIAAHLDMHVDDNLRAGMTHEEARRGALIKLGGVESLKEHCRDRSTLPLLDTVLQDTRFAIRQLRKNAGFTIAAILTLAIGVCASAALFAFVDAALIRPLPYPNSDRLVHVTETSAGRRANLCYLDYLDWKKENSVFQSLSVYNGTGYLLSSPQGPVPIPAARVSDGFFRTLGIAPALGRDFYAGEDLAGTPNTAILSYGTWQKRFGGLPGVVGRTIRLSGVPYTVVGILPRTFAFAPRGAAEIWTTLHAAGSCDLNRSCHNLQAVARLKDGVSVAAALRDTEAIAERLEREYPGSNRSQGASVLPLSEVIVGNVRPILLALLCAGILLLTIACLNVASLLLVRSESRRREIAVRTSLGASSQRLVTQFVTEASVLIVGGVGTGMLLAGCLIRIFVTLVPENKLADMPYLQNIGLNSHVWAFGLAVALLAVISLSIIPSLHLRLYGIREGLAEGDRGSSGKAWRRLGANLVIVELAIAMMLLMSAGLLGRSVYRLLQVGLGLQPDHVATLSVAIPRSKYANDEQTVAISRRILERLQAIPGVRAAALTSDVPVSFNGDTDWIRFVGKPYHGEHNEVNQRDVSAEYFQAIGSRLLRGRGFTDADDQSKPKVVIINEALAKQYFPGQNPLGKRFGDDGLSPNSIREVIGVVENIREGALDSEIWPAEYLPFQQSPDSNFWLVARTSQGEQSVLRGMSAAVHQLDPDLGAFDEATMSERINSSPTAYLHRSAAWLVGGFAGIALLLSVVGLYGVVAYSVSQRTREIGIRMALGAERGNVHRLILREAARVTGGGLAGGLLCSLAAASLMRKLLFGVTSWDVPTLVAVLVVLGTASLLASYVPARRAAAVSPIEALRTE